MDVQTRISDFLRRNREFIKRKNELDNEAARMMSALANKLGVFADVVVGDDLVRINNQGREVSLYKHPGGKSIIRFGVKVDYAKGTVEYTHMGLKADMNGVLELALEAVEKEFGGNS